MSASRWEKAADRANARNAAKAPLFAHAGLVPVVTAEIQRFKVETEHEAFLRRSAEVDARLSAHADEMRSIIAAHVSPDELSALDKRRHDSPPTPAYAADFWRQRAKEKGIEVPDHYGSRALLAEVDRRIAAMPRDPATGAEQLTIGGAP